MRSLARPLIPLNRCKGTNNFPICKIFPQKSDKNAVFKYKYTLNALKYTTFAYGRFILNTPVARVSKRGRISQPFRTYLSALRNVSLGPTGRMSLLGRICRSASRRVTLGLSKNPTALNISICNATTIISANRPSGYSVPLRGRNLTNLIKSNKSLQYTSIIYL